MKNKNIHIQKKTALANRITSHKNLVILIFIFGLKKISKLKMEIEY